MNNQPQVAWIVSLGKANTYDRFATHMWPKVVGTDEL